MKRFFTEQSSSAFASLQRFGKALMLPIAMLPASGLLLGIGGTLSNQNTLKAFDFLNINWLQNIFMLMEAAGNIVFANLPVLFAVGLSTGLARQDRGTVGLAAIVSMLITNATIHTALKITGRLADENISSVGQGMCLGIQTLETGVFGGMLVGLMVYWFHKKFYKTSLPPYLGFFNGSRFVPIICLNRSGRATLCYLAGLSIDNFRLQ